LGDRPGVTDASYDVDGSGPRWPAPDTRGGGTMAVVFYMIPSQRRYAATISVSSTICPHHHAEAARGRV